MSRSVRSGVGGRVGLWDGHFRWFRFGVGVGKQQAKMGWAAPSTPSQHVGVSVGMGLLRLRPPPTRTGCTFFYPLSLE